MTSNHTNINKKTKQQSKQNSNNTFNISRIHITLYKNYILLYCKGHIQMTSNNSNINVEIKTNTLNKITTTHSICSEFILGYTYKMLKIYLKIKHGKNIQASMSYYKQLRLTRFIADIRISCYRIHFEVICPSHKQQIQNSH